LRRTTDMRPANRPALVAALRNYLAQFDQWRRAYPPAGVAARAAQVLEHIDNVGFMPMLVSPLRAPELESTVAPTRAVWPGPAAWRFPLRLHELVWLRLYVLGLDASRRLEQEAEDEDYAMAWVIEGAMRPRDTDRRRILGALFLVPQLGAQALFGFFLRRSEAGGEADDDENWEELPYARERLLLTSEPATMTDATVEYLNAYYARFAGPNETVRPAALYYFLYAVAGTRAVPYESDLWLAADRTPAWPEDAYTPAAWRLLALWRARPEFKAALAMVRAWRGGGELGVSRRMARELGTA
jgi:hypothetical protein